MRFLRTAMAGVLVLTAFIAPAAALGSQRSVTKTAGEWTGVAPYWRGTTSSVVPYTYSWRWSIRGADGDRPAAGTLRYTVTRRASDGTFETLADQTVNVVSVTRTNANTVEVTFDATVDAPGSDPMWVSNRLRFVDNGRAGDELLMWCWRCNPVDMGVFHPIRDTGTVRVWSAASR